MSEHEHDKKGMGQTPIGASPDSDALVDLAEIEDQKLIENKDASLSQGQMVWRRFRNHKAAMASVIVLAGLLILAFTSIGFMGIPGWWDKNYYTPQTIVNGGAPTLNLIPGSGFGLGEHPFGQDNIGKDYFALVMRGTQQSFIIAIVVGLISTFIGTMMGSISGYFGGWVDSVLMRLTDIVIVIPLLVIAAVLGQMASGNIFWLALVLGLVTWTGLARLVRGEVLSLKEKEFVAAARSMGAHAFRIIFKHLIPNTVGVIVVNATFAIAGAILLETSLSYLNFGVQPPETSLGLLISDYQNSFKTRPWLFWWPGMFILVIALSVNFIGDGLRDAFDPRQTKPTLKTRRNRKVLES